MRRPIQKKIKYFLLYHFVKLLLSLSSFIPRRGWIKACGFLGGVTYHLLPATRKQTIRHLTIAFEKEKSAEEILRLSKKVFVRMGQNAGDIFRSLKVGSLENLKRFLTIHGLENCEAARAKGKGVITLTLHLGAFDLQATALALLGFSPYIIGTALKDERLNALLKNYRNAYGAIAIERGKETVRLFKALKNGGSLAILIDQDTDVQSVFVNFFNRPASTPLGAAMLALRSGAAVVPMYIYLDDNLRQQMHFLPEIELARTGNDREDIVVNTQIFTSLAEELIRKYPEQWVWMHERWRTQPSAEKN